jgi:hypothetical protein
MNEPALRPRQAIDLDEFERRLRTVAPVQKPEDPLAELARLVGQDDPFRMPFSEASRARQERRQEPRLESPEPRREERSAATHQEPVLRPSPKAAPLEPASWETPHLRPGTAAFADLRRSVVAETPPPPSDLDEPWGSPDFTAPRRQAANESFVPPQAVAVVGAEDDPWLTDDAVLPPPPPPAAAPKASRRGLYASAGIGAVALLTLGILYAFKGNVLTASGEPPIIRAMNGPTKVPPPDAGAPEVADADTTVLDHSATPDKRQSTRVVSHEEQPVDLGHAQGAGEDTKAGPVMEPKRVKTMVVRADGTIVGNEPAPTGAAAPPAPASAPPPPAAPAAGPLAIFPPLAPSSEPAEPAPQAKPATPKATARVATTPKVGAAAIATTAPAGPATLTKPRPPRPAAPAAKPALEAAADAAPDPTPTGATGGGFAVQLAAPASEQEAHDVAARLQKKFAAQLDGMKPSIKQADAGGRQVYRVRVGNLSREEAAALCDKLKAGGGACFIAKN